MLICPPHPRSGHEVPAYAHGTLGVGEAAFQMYSQIMRNQSLASTSPGSGPSSPSGSPGSAVGQPSESNSSPVDSSSLWAVLGSAVLGLTLVPL